MVFFRVLGLLASFGSSGGLTSAGVASGTCEASGVTAEENPELRALYDEAFAQ